MFITVGLGEEGFGEHMQVDVPDYSSLRVKETIGEYSL